MLSAKQTLRLGVRATALMSASFLLHPHLRPPPQIVAYNAARAVGVEPERLSWSVRNAYWVAAHLAFGTTLTAARQLLPKPQSDVVYGLSIWLANYGIALPVTRLYPAPARDKALRVAGGVIAHAVFGVCLGRRARAGPPDGTPGQPRGSAWRAGFQPMTGAISRAIFSSIAWL